MGFRVDEEGFFQDWFDWFGSCWIMGTLLWKVKLKENSILMYILVERGERGERERRERERKRQTETNREHARKIAKITRIDN